MADNRSYSEIKFDKGQAGRTEDSQDFLGEQGVTNKPSS